MAAPEMEVIKEIPGYKVIMKAVLKSQIQQLVEQLAMHTDEESVILTASVSDGTLSHLGSDSGKNFLEDHEDIKSQFLGFCLRKHHKKKQQEKEEQEREKEREEAMRNMPVTPTRPSPRAYSIRSPRFPSPRQQGVFPMAMHRAARPMQAPGGMRHEPYPRPMKRPLNFDPTVRGQSPLPLRMPLSGQIIKIEPDDTEGGESNAQTMPRVPEGGDQSHQDSSVPSSPSQSNLDRPASVKSERIDRDDDARSNSSTSTIPNEAADMKQSDTIPPEGLSLDSDLSSLLPLTSDDAHQPPDMPQASTSASSDIDPNVNVKLEAITESEMELEITGVELAPQTPGTPQETWGPGSSGATGYGSPAGNQAMQQQQGYKVNDERKWVKEREVCHLCGKTVSKGKLKLHIRTHTGERPYLCSRCPRAFADSTARKKHFLNIHKDAVSSILPWNWSEKRLENTDEHRNAYVAPKKIYPTCEICGKVFGKKSRLKYHMKIHDKEPKVKVDYKCDHCGKEFKGKSALTRHIRTHTGERPFKCSVCLKAFAENSCLKQHFDRRHKKYFESLHSKKLAQVEKNDTP